MLGAAHAMIGLTFARHMERLCHYEDAAYACLNRYLIGTYQRLAGCS